jgi:hypothetical protein
MQNFEKVIERVNDLISHGSIGEDLTIPVKAKHLAKILSETEILNTIRNYKMSVTPTILLDEEKFTSEELEKIKSIKTLEEQNNIENNELYKKILKNTKSGWQASANLEGKNGEMQALSFVGEDFNLVIISLKEEFNEQLKKIQENNRRSHLKIV